MLYILPTDTCYGIAWHMTKADFEKIYELKWRDTSKKLALLVRDFDELAKIAIVTEKQISFLKNYSSPFSVLLPPNSSYDFPEFLKIDNYALISVRIWEKCLSKNMLNALSFPLFLTSANKTGHTESVTFSQAKAIFENISGFDEGVCDQKPSNIFSFWNNDTINFIRKNY